MGRLQEVRSIDFGIAYPLRVPGYGVELTGIWSEQSGIRDGPVYVQADRDSVAHDYFDLVEQKAPACRRI